MQSEELFDRLEAACREAGGYLIHSKDALAKRLDLAEKDRGELTAQLKTLSEQGKVVVERRGRAGLLVALPDVQLPELQKNRERRRRSNRRSASAPGQTTRAPDAQTSARWRSASGRAADGPGEGKRPGAAAAAAARSAHKSTANHFCPWCGKPIALKWNYCANCGEPLETVKDLYASC